MFPHLQIYDPRERWLVGTADALLTAATRATRLLPHRAPVWPPRRILLLRLERIGDLLMSAPAIAAVRTLAPQATIDLVVGSWNEHLAKLIPGIDHVETLDAPWLARGTSRRNTNHLALLHRAWTWRARHYDLAINFEGDIRTHALLALSAAPMRVGFDMAGGGPFLTTRVDFHPTTHTTENAWHLIDATFGSTRGGSPETRGDDPSQAMAHQPSHGPARESIRLLSGWSSNRSAPSRAMIDEAHVLMPREPGNGRASEALDAKDREARDAADGELRQAVPPPLAASNVATATAGGVTRFVFRLAVPQEARERAAAVVGRHGERMLIGVHVSGGRAIKQWAPARFAAVAARLAREYGALLLLTGTSGDQAIVGEMRHALPGGIDVLDLVGEIDLPLLAAMLERCRLLLTGDTGPMHLAAFVGTPVVAVFGPSDPVRYAPLASPHRVVRIDLPCAPCNRIRLPPARCQGHTPDCLEGVTADAVYAAAESLLAETADGREPSLARGSS